MPLSRKHSSWHSYPYTRNPNAIGFQYIMVEYNMILDTKLQNERIKAKFLFKLWTHKRHPTPCSYGWAIGGLLLSSLEENTAGHWECAVLWKMVIILNLFDASMSHIYSLSGLLPDGCFYNGCNDVNKVCFCHQNLPFNFSKLITWIKLVPCTNHVLKPDVIMIWSPFSIPNVA